MTETRETQGRPTIGLALGGGGARGWCHIGVLRELDAMGLRPDVVAGTSMGALVGAFYAAHRLDDLEDFARSLTMRSFIGMLDLRPVSGGMVEGREIGKVIRRYIPYERIEDLPLPFAIVATDIRTGRDRAFEDGPLANAIRASVALPGILSPQEMNGDWYLDGGLTNPLPVSACYGLGADIVIAAEPNGRSDGLFWSNHKAVTEGSGRSWADFLPDQPAFLKPYLPTNRTTQTGPGLLDTLAVASDIVMDGIRRARLAGDPPQVFMEAQLSHMTILEFHRADEAIAEGRRIVRAHEEAITRVSTPRA